MHAGSSLLLTLQMSALLQVCAEHKKPAKLLKHLANIKEKSSGMRNPPRVLVFANRIKVSRLVIPVCRHLPLLAFEQAVSLPHTCCQLGPEHNLSIHASSLLRCMVLSYELRHTPG